MGRTVVGRPLLGALLLGASVLGGAQLVAVPPAFAVTQTTLFVTAAASAGNTTCTQVAPCQTIAQAVAAAQSYPGQDVTINLAAGTYTEVGVTLDGADLDLLTLTGAGLDNTHISGSGTPIGGLSTPDDGGIFVVEGRVAIDGMFMDTGSATTYGGAIFEVGSGVQTKAAKLTLTEDVLEFDRAGSAGGAVVLGVNATLTAKSTTFAADTATTGGAVAIPATNGQGNYGGLTFVSDDFSQNAAQNGAAVFVAGGSDGSDYQLHVTDTTFTEDHTATFDTGEPVATTGGSGGAVDISATGTFTFTTATFSTDSAGDGGGALAVYNGGSLTVQSSVFHLDSAPSRGGAVTAVGTRYGFSADSFTTDTTTGTGGALYLMSSTQSMVQDSTFSGDRADDGGAIWENTTGTVAQYATLVLTNDTFATDSATAHGGAVDWLETPYLSGALSLYFTTFINDTADLGGAIFNGDVTADTTGGPHDVTYATSIFDASTCAGGTGFEDAGYNLESGSTCPMLATSRTTVTTWGLASSLAANTSTGPKTLAIVSPTSPALALVPVTSCTPATDERGLPRPGKGETPTYCDAGAFEATLPLVTPLAVTVTLTPTAIDLGYGAETATAFSVTVTGTTGSGHPLGTIAVSVAGTPVAATCTLSSTFTGTALHYTCSIAAAEFTAGTSTLLVTFTPGTPSSSQATAAYTSGTSTPASLDVAPAATTLQLSVTTTVPAATSIDPVTATVTPAAGVSGTPHGTVQVSVTGTAACTITVTSDTGCTGISFSAGTHEVDGAFVPSTTNFLGSDAASELEVTGIGPPLVTLTAISTTYGAETATTFTVTVAGAVGHGYPIGTVTELSVQSDLVAVTCVASATHATTTTTFTCHLTTAQAVGAGTYPSTFVTYDSSTPSSSTDSVTYSGTTSDTAVLTVGKAGSVLSLQATTSHPLLTAKDPISGVAGAQSPATGTPTGTVAVTETGTPLCTLTVTTDQGCTDVTFGAGVHHITGVFTPSTTNFEGSSDTLTITVGTTPTVTVSPPSLTYGAETASSLTVTVAGQYGVPLGAISLTVTGTTAAVSCQLTAIHTTTRSIFTCQLATGEELSGGSFPDTTATFTPGTPSSATAGRLYFASTSTAVDLEVGRAMTTTTLMGTTTPAAGAHDPLTVSVAAVAPATGTPAGTVAVTVTGSALCSITLPAGTGCSTVSFSAGPHHLVATFTPSTVTFSGSSGTLGVTATAAGGPAGSPATSASRSVAVMPTGQGYWVLVGGVPHPYGTAVSYGSPSGTLSAPVVGMAATPTGKGYWLVAGDGGVFAYGAAAFSGSLPGLGLSVHDVVALVPATSGYWLVTADGSVYSFGAAAFHGSLPGLGITPEAGVVGGSAAPTGGGYWLVAADGGVYSFGTAGFHGSLPGLGIATTVVRGITATADGGGYRLVGADGGVFCFGDAPFYGSLGAAASGPYAGLIVMPTATTYDIVATSGAETSF